MTYFNVKFYILNSYISLFSVAKCTSNSCHCCEFTILREKIL